MKQLKTKTLVLIITLLFIQVAAPLFSQSQVPYPCSCTLGVCNGSTAFHDYSGIAGWGSVISNPGSMAIANGVMNYVSTPGSDYNRMVGGVNALINHPLTFIAECRITITGGNGPGHYVMAFTENNNDPISTDAAGYPLTNNDALGVTIIKEGGAPSSGSCCTNPCLTNQRWLLQIFGKDGAGAPFFSPQGVPVRCQLAPTYYVRLVRSHCWTYLGVYSDAGFTTHVPGSPVCMEIPETITGLRRIQHGVITWSSVERTLSMTLDNTKVCPYTGGCTTAACDGVEPIAENKTAGHEIMLGEESSKNSISITPNPSSGIFKLNISKADEKITSIAIYDLSGKIYKLINKIDNKDAIFINGSDLKDGMYMVEAYSKSKSWKSAIIIQR